MTLWVVTLQKNLSRCPMCRRDERGLTVYVCPIHTLRVRAFSDALNAILSAAAVPAVGGTTSVAFKPYGPPPWVQERLAINEVPDGDSLRTLALIEGHA